MTDTIPNVPRELLADLLGNDHDKRITAERNLLAMLANAPSPADVYSADPLACPGCASGCFLCESTAGADGVQPTVSHTMTCAAQAVIWQPLVEDTGSFEPALLVQRDATGLLIITQEGRDILIQPETLPELIKQLRLLAQ